MFIREWSALFSCPSISGAAVLLLRMLTLSWATGNAAPWREHCLELLGLDLRVPETLESALNDLTPSEADWWSSADVDGDCSVNSV